MTANYLHWHVLLQCTRICATASHEVLTYVQTQETAPIWYLQGSFINSKKPHLLHAEKGKVMWHNGHTYLVLPKLQLFAPE